MAYAPTREREVVLTEFQRQAITAPGGKLVFLGGPGSGKSLVVVERATRLVGEGQARPEQILILAPTPRAAHRLRRLISRPVAGTMAPTITSFHGLARTVLRDYHREMGYPYPPTVVDTRWQRLILRRMLAAEEPASWSHYANSLRTTALCNLVYDFTTGLSLNGLVEEHLRALPAEWLDEHAPLIGFCTRYGETMRRRGLIDFGEMLAGTARLLATDPEIRRILQERYLHVLVDEYEEATYVQAQILSYLIDEQTDLLVAGDPAEAIEGFRYGTPLHLRAIAEKSGVTVIRSLENLRSSPRVASLASAVRIWSAGNDSPEEREHGDDHRPPEGRLEYGGKAEGYAVIRPFGDISGEAHWVATEVESLRRSGVPLTEIAILLRASSAPVARAISRELDRRGIPYQGRATRLVGEDPLIGASIDLLRVLTNAAESEEAFLRVLRSPLGGLPPSAVQSLADVADAAGISLLDLSKGSAPEVPLSADLGQTCHALFDRLAQLRAKLEWSLPSLLWEIWRGFPIFHRDALGSGRGSRAFSAFLDEVSDLEDQRRVKAVPDLLKLWDEGYFDQLPAWARRQTGVTMAMVHEAKGQEWDVVFLPGLVDGEFPRFPLPTEEVLSFLAPGGLALQSPVPEGGLLAWQSLQRDRHFAEEKRVFYVGISRPRKGVYLSYSCRLADGRLAPLRSGFLDLLDDREEVEVIPEESKDAKPVDLDDAVVYYRKLLAAEDPLRQAQALYTLASIGERWPETLSATSWWANTRETEGAAPPFPSGRLHLSASRLAQYRDCPLAYQYAYHWGLRGPEGAALTIGSLLHAILEEYHGVGGERPRTLETLKDLLERHFDGKAFRYRPVARQAKTNLDDMLERYFGRYGQARAILATERRFRFSFGLHAVNGIIDRIDRLASGKLELIDYKTGGAMTNAEAEKDLQLALYDLAFYADPALRALGQPEKVSYLYLKNIGPRADGKRSYAPDDESRARFRLRANLYAKAILNERFPSPRSIAEAFPGLDLEDLDLATNHNPCLFCGFLWICPEMER